MVLQQRQKYISNSKKFKVDRKEIRNQVTGEGNIRKQKSKRKNVQGRKAQYPPLEEELL